MHTILPRHSCDSLGVCQQHTPACLGCEHHALATSVQASRDTGCCVPFGTDDDQPITSAERIAYWCAVGLATGCTLGLVAGLSGYLFVRLLA